jgi:aminopeptidase
MKGKAEGIVYSTKPLSYQGQLIENFFIRFENGKAVDSGAEKNAELLATMLSMDEGAAYLGECALVPQVSPIAQSGILFYETLFDENASCHLAMGAGFPDTIEGHHDKTLEECRALGINDSMIHVDFMIGCDTMNIDATTRDGKVIPIFRNGNWAF